MTLSRADRDLAGSARRVTPGLGNGRDPAPPVGGTGPPQTGCPGYVLRVEGSPYRAFSQRTP